MSPVQTVPYGRFDEWGKSKTPNELTAIDETECLSPSQSPENSFLQPSPTKLTITKTYSNKEKFMLIFNGYNLQFLNFNRKKTINVGDVQTEVV
ncbi:unnamed protein product, partial [Rotaria magnacalcarata]